MRSSLGPRSGCNAACESLRPALVLRDDYAAKSNAVAGRRRIPPFSIRRCLKTIRQTITLTVGRSP